MNDNNSINKLNINDVQNYVLPNIANLLKSNAKPLNVSAVESQQFINSIFQKISTPDPSDEDINSFKSLIDKTIELIKKNEKSGLTLDKIKSAISQLKKLETFNTALLDGLDVSIDERLTSIFKKTEDTLKHIQTELESPNAVSESPLTSRTSTPTAPDSASESSKTSPKVIKLSSNQMKREGPISLAWEQFKSFVSRPSEKSASIEKTSDLEKNPTSDKLINELIENIKTFLGPKHQIPDTFTSAIKSVLGNHKEIFDKFNNFLDDCKKAKILNKQKLDKGQTPEFSDIHNERTRNHRTNLFLTLTSLQPNEKPMSQILQTYLAVFSDLTGIITNMQINTDSFQYGLVKDFEKNNQNSTTISRFLNGLNKYNTYGSEGFLPRYNDCLLFQRSTWTDIKYNGDQRVTEAKRLLEFTFPKVEGEEETTKVTIDHDKIFKLEVPFNFDHLLSHRSFDIPNHNKLLNLLTTLSGITYNNKSTYTMGQYEAIIKLLQTDQFKKIQSELEQLDKEIKEIEISLSKEESNSKKFQELDAALDKLYALQSKKNQEMEIFLKSNNIQNDPLFDTIRELNIIFDKNIEQVITFGKVALEFNVQLRNAINKQLIALSE